MTRGFSRFACIDWSGAKGERQKGIALALCASGDAAPRLTAPSGGWSRATMRDWLVAQTASDADLLVGIDFSPSLPFADHGAFFPGWPDSPADGAALWELIDRLCTDEPNLGAGPLVDHGQASRYFRRHGGRLGDLFGEVPGGRLRVVEREVRDVLRIAAQSCFNLVGAAQVGKSSLTGMRLLHALRGRVPIWPFDPVPASGPLIVEIYTTIAARAAGVRRGRSKIRDAVSLDAALRVVGSLPHLPLDRYDDHSTDAILTAAWLRGAASRDALWRPAALTDALARTEGWTFGVP